MSGEKVVRYTAGDIARMRDGALRRIANEGMYPATRFDAIKTVDSVEFVGYADVAVLVEALEKIEIAASQGATQVVRELTQQAIARFQP